MTDAEAIGRRFAVPVNWEWLEKLCFILVVIFSTSFTTFVLTAHTSGLARAQVQALAQETTGSSSDRVSAAVADVKITAIVARLDALDKQQALNVANIQDLEKAEGRVEGAGMSIGTIIIVLASLGLLANRKKTT